MVNTPPRVRKECEIEKYIQKKREGRFCENYIDSDMFSFLFFFFLSVCTGNGGVFLFCSCDDAMALKFLYFGFFF